ncbi:MAG TPA: hypothetical protein ENI77_04770 [Nitrospirae bacterium]|nr:hypothetical protein [Nitrospirota bacterium]
MVKRISVTAGCKKIVIFGADHGGFAVVDLAAMCGWKIIWFVDTDKSKWNSSMSGYRIRNPEILKSREFDLLVISSLVDHKLAVKYMDDIGFERGKDYIFSQDQVVINDFTLSLKLPHVMESGKKTVIYGAGQGGMQAMDMALRYGWEIKYFVDSARAKWGESFRGHAIIRPEALMKRDFDLIIVASLPGKKNIFAALGEMGFEYGKDFIFFQDEIT